MNDIICLNVRRHTNLTSLERNNLNVYMFKLKSKVTNVQKTEKNTIKFE